MYIWLCFNVPEHDLIHAEESMEPEEPGEPPFSNDTCLIQHCFEVTWNGEIPILQRKEV